MAGRVWYWDGQTYRHCAGLPERAEGSKALPVAKSGGRRGLAAGSSEPVAEIAGLVADSFELLGGSAGPAAGSSGAVADSFELLGGSSGPAEGDAVIIGSVAAELGKLPVRRLVVLNEAAPAFTAWRWDELARRLRRSGVAIRQWDQPSAGEREYAVRLFHLQPVVVEAIPAGGRAPFLHGGASQRFLSEQDARYRPLVRLAARALYACGLDIGIVELMENGEGKCLVNRIQLPEEAAYEDGVWREAIDGLAQQLLAAERNAGKRPHILVGADPEFLLISEQGKVVSAVRYLEGGHGAGCDALVVGGKIQYPIAELRPSPADTPEVLARNIRQLLRQAAKRIPDRPPLRWAAGGMPAAGFALGGHLHMSGVPLTGRLLHQLDSYVAFPLVMIETPSEQARRPRYGALGDFRLQSHGGFEYRTLPSWLASPLAAKAAFALALLCARESDALAYMPATEDCYIEAYYAGDRATLAGCMEELAAAMAATASYAELGKWIEPLLDAIRAGRTWDSASDFRPKWGVIPGG